MDAISTPTDQESAVKKGSPFDNLSRDDLVKKCRGLLGIAQKAKQAKDESLEENKHLKERLAQAETQKTADKECLKAMQEMVDSLTEQKLKAAMRVDELEKSTAGLMREMEGAGLLSERMEKISLENEAFKRQIGRLTEENEELLGDLSSMEDKLKDAEARVKSLEEQQQTITQSSAALEQELLRAKNDAASLGREEKLLRKLKLYKNKVQEISAKVLLLKSDRKILLKTVREYSEQVPKWQKELSNASSIMFARTQQLERECSEYKEKCTIYEQDLNDLERLRQENSLITVEVEQEQIKNRQLILEISQLESKLMENASRDQQIQELNERLHDSGKSVEEHKAIEVTLQQKLIDMEQKLQSEISDKEFTAGKFELDMQNRMDEVHKLFQEQVRELQAVNDQLSAIEKDNIARAMPDDLQERMDELQKQFATQKNELETKNLKIAAFEEEQQFSEKLKQDINDMQIEAEQLKLSKNALRLEIENLQTKTDNYEVEIERLQKRQHETTSALESLQGRYDILTAENQQFQTTHDKLSQEYCSSSEELGTVRSKFELIKLENSELLSELKEINEILKERGGVISLQLSKISELEAQKNALQQKLNELDCPDVAQLRQNVVDLERNLAEREMELSTLRDRDRSFDVQSDVMSTSTISRAEELSRMRDVDDSFEEKYMKLRSLAVKLKKKVAEQTIQLQKHEKERDATGLGKNLQSLQAEYDKLLDQLESERKTTERLEAELKQHAEQLEQKEQEIETLSQVRLEVDSSKKDKSSLEDTIREYKEQLQSLKREKEAFNLAKKDIDGENQKLKASLKMKEKQLADEQDAQKELKAEAERLRLAAKKTNVLNLEMEAYEKSLAELNKKLETKKTEVTGLEGTLEAQEGTIKSLRSQIALLEQSLNGERNHSQELKKNVDVQQEKLRISEHQRGEVNVELAQLKVDYEKIKLEIESNRVELSEALTEKGKFISNSEGEKTKLLKQVYGLESEVNELRSKVDEREQEIEDVKTEFASYKIRAQSVLRQNQSKDSGKERELEEEVQNLQKALEHAQNKLQSCSQQTSELSKSCQELGNDKTKLQGRCKELHDLLEETRLQNESLLEEARRSNLNHQEALKTQRLQNETLVNCYKKQLEEIQERHVLELETLKSRVSQTARNVQPEVSDRRNNNQSTLLASTIHRGQQISDEQKINLLLMEREECEGSENTSTAQQVVMPHRKISNSSQNQRTRSNRDLIPLDELLNSSFDDSASVFDATDDSLRTVSPSVELQQTKEKLTKQESRVRHLAALLAEAEQDLAKLTQLNELLKEEVRRQERSIEREKHVHNSEYLKNVIFKFLTLNNGDEKSRLVPVLNTILRLSPEETQKLNNAAKGAEGGSRWTGILWN